jgi:hypothetical protein
MPMHHTKPDGPLPPAVKDNLTAADIDDLFKEVRQAHQQLEQIEKEKTTPTITPSTPTTPSL